MKQKFLASDKFVAWAQSLSGMLTTMKTEYGSISDMVERSDWDGAKTEFALTLLRSLRSNITKIEKELSDHVKGKFG